LVTRNFQNYKILFFNTQNQRNYFQLIKIVLVALCLFVSFFILKKPPPDFYFKLKTYFNIFLPSFSLFVLINITNNLPISTITQKKIFHFFIIKVMQILRKQLEAKSNK